MTNVEQAIKVIKDGGIVIYPTDTAYGIGCRIDNEKSLERLFDLRKRPENKAMPVLFDLVERVKEFVLPFDEDIENLMEKYWPGALTIVLPCEVSKVPALIRGGGETLGVRIPDHEIALSLIKGAGVPIAGPSANFAGEKTPYTFEGLDKQLIKLVDFVIEGKTKEKELSSTVVDCTKKPWKIIRQGQIVMPDL